MLILAGVSINAIVGDNGIITNSQNAKIATEEAALWETIQEILVEAYGNEFETIDDFLLSVQNKFSTQISSDYIATAEVYDENEGTILVTYGIDESRLYGKIFDKEFKQVGEFSLAVGKTAATGGEWVISKNLTKGTCQIIGYSGSYGDVSIPNVIYDTDESGNLRGYVVTILGDSVFAGQTTLTSIKFNTGLISIGSRCFDRCTNLACEVKFPNSLVSIGDYAFSRCTKITGNLDTIVNRRNKFRNLCV